MDRSRVCRTVAGLLAAVAVIGAARLAVADEPTRNTRPSADRRTTEFRPQESRVPGVAADHPLLPELSEAREWLAQARRTVHDFQCRVVKRERIDGILQDYYYIDMWVREEARAGDHVTAPLSVFMEFLGPSSAQGRRLLYVEGSNEGKILVRKGGKRFEYVITKVDPDSESTRSESLCPISQSGFIPLFAETVATIERHMAADPFGANTIVERLEGAKVDGRPCHVLRITHPQQQDGLDFYKGTYFVDAELGVPARIEKLDWPTRPGETPPLLAEYNYTKVRLNLGLTDKMFNPKALKARR
ncbi:MAG: DUF1571 domain-containing protein [Pirellulales bacterium]